jgi:hypothetical protein
MMMIVIVSWSETTGTDWVGGWVGLRADLDTEAREKIVYLCRGSNTGRPVCSSGISKLFHFGAHLIVDFLGVTPICYSLSLIVN